MDFFNADVLQLGITDGGSQISLWDRERIGKLQPADEEVLSQIVAELGVRSGRAQGLSASITTLQRVQQRGNLLFVHCTRNGLSTRVQGFIKTGILNLFLADDKGTYDAVNASCLLDFYVCESCQRQGVGKALFAFALKQLSTVPEFLAYDRPSSKLKAFLAKHYGLFQGITQPNNFVIFKGFFQGNKRAHHKEQRQLHPEYARMGSSTGTIKYMKQSAPRSCSWDTVVPHVHAGDTAPAVQYHLQGCCQAERDAAAVDVRTAMRQGASDFSSMKGMCGDDGRSHMRRTVPDHWVLPHAVRSPDRASQNHTQVKGSGICRLRSLPSVNLDIPHCKDTRKHYDGYDSASMHEWDHTGRVEQRVADPELTAALKPVKGFTPADVSAKVFSQGNHLCNLLFDQPNTANRSGLQYTLGGADCHFASTAATWDQYGREKASRRRFHRARR